MGRTEVAVPLVTSRRSFLDRELATDRLSLLTHAAGSLDLFDVRSGERYVARRVAHVHRYGADLAGRRFRLVSTKV